MTLQSTGSGQATEDAIREHVNIRNVRLNIEKGDRLLSTDQVADQKSRPGTA